MPVAQSAASAFEEHDRLAVLHDIAEVLARFGIVGHGAAGHVNVFVLAVRTMGAAFRTVAAVASENVALIAQVEQGPIVVVGAQIDVPTSAAIAAIGAAVGLILGAVQVHRASAALTRAAVNLDVVGKVAFSHI